MGSRPQSTAAWAGRWPSAGTGSIIAPMSESCRPEDDARCRAMGITDTKKVYTSEDLARGIRQAVERAEARWIGDVMGMRIAALALVRRSRR